MAPKNQALARQPSNEEQEREESSGEEEYTESDSGETEEGSSEEEEENPVSKPQTLVQKSELKSKSTSRVNGSDSDDDTEGSPPDYKVQPIRKPSPPPAKRPHQDREEGQDVSRSSKKLKTEEKEVKKSSNSTPGGLITRLWSDEDEITILNGMVEFRKAKGHDNNSEEIYNFIKGKLQRDFNKEQLRTKISRMKKRFLNTINKSGGSDPVFSKPHEDMAFELSKKIWGDAANVSGAVKNGNAKKEVVKNGKAKKEIVKAEAEEKDDAEERDFWSKYPYLSSSFLNLRGNIPSLSLSESSMCLLKENLSSIGDAKAKELNQKWRQLFVEEAEVNHKMLTLMAEQTKLGLSQINDG